MWRGFGVVYKGSYRGNDAAFNMERNGEGAVDLHETDALHDAVLEHVVHSSGHGAHTFPR